MEYVAGLMFSADARHLAVVEKKKPAWQRGKINAIGGKIEKGETALSAMRREFLEETGVLYLDWQELAILKGSDFIVYFFTAFTDLVDCVHTVEEEEIYVWPTGTALVSDAVIPNLRVLIPLALDQSGIVKPVMLFDSSLQEPTLPLETPQET